MPTVIREIDPDYDTVIVLEQPCKNFAPWNPTNEILEPDEPGLELEAWPAPLEDYCDDAIPTSIADDGVSTGHIDPEAKAGASLSRADAHPTETELSQDVLSLQNDKTMKTIENAVEDEEEIVHYYVSSRHLTLVSPWFKRTLTSTGSKEAVPNPKDGRFYISASGWDEEAFLILLNIFHLRKRQIPKTISLELFAKIAVLVDYYELKNAEAIEDYVDIWAAHTRHSYAVPTSYGRDLVLWMCVSAIFDLSNEFEKATAVAIQRSTGLIQTLSLPIPLRAIYDIDHKRIDTIGHINSKILRLLERYRNVNYSCPHESNSKESYSDKSYSFQCGAFLFGALHKQLEGWGFLSRGKRSPFNGLSLEGIYSKMDAVKSPIWYHGDTLRSKKRCDHPSHPCSLKEEIEKIIQYNRESFDGLKLSEWKDDK